MDPTRGERNNNPGNIDRTTIKWQGMSYAQSSDPRFVVFDSAVCGIRALAKILLSYYDKDGCTTVQTMIDRWAPSGENNSGAYVQDVAAQCGVSAGVDIDPHNQQVLENLVTAIIKHENGRVIYDAATIADGVSRALES